MEYIVTLFNFIKYDYYIFCGCLLCANTHKYALLLDIVKIKTRQINAWFVFFDID